MEAIKVKEDVYWVGVKDWNLTEFHGYHVSHGSTYNAYLIKDEKIALIDGVKHYLSSENIARIRSVTDFSKIDYIIVNHVELDHSGKPVSFPINHYRTDVLQLQFIMLLLP